MTYETFQCRMVTFRDRKLVHCVLDASHYREGGPPHEFEDGSTEPVSPTISVNRMTGKKTEVWYPMRPPEETS